MQRVLTSLFVVCAAEANGKKLQAAAARTYIWAAGARTVAPTFVESRSVKFGDNNVVGISVEDEGDFPSQTGHHPLTGPRNSWHYGSALRMPFRKRSSRDRSQDLPFARAIGSKTVSMSLSRRAFQSVRIPADMTKLVSSCNTLPDSVSVLHCFCLNIDIED
nr:hypothetical protein CFP56_10371 [Quercus suber]